MGGLWVISCVHVGVRAPVRAGELAGVAAGRRTVVRAGGSAYKAACARVHVLLTHGRTFVQQKA